MSDEIQWNYVDISKLKLGDIVVNVNTPRKPFNDFTKDRNYTIVYSPNLCVADDKGFYLPVYNTIFKDCFVTLEEHDRVMNKIIKKEYKVITGVQKDIKAGDKVLCVSEDKALPMFQDKKCIKGGIYNTFKGWYDNPSYVTVPYNGGWDISGNTSSYKKYFIKLDENIGIRFNNYVKAIKSIKLNKVYRLKKRNDGNFEFIDDDNFSFTDWHGLCNLNKVNVDFEFVELGDNKTDDVQEPVKQPRKKLEYYTIKKYKIPLHNVDKKQFELLMSIV